MVGYIREAQQPQHHELLPCARHRARHSRISVFLLRYNDRLIWSPGPHLRPMQICVSACQQSRFRHALVRSALCFGLAKVCPGCLEASRLCGSPLGGDFLFSMGSWLWWLGTF
ncbi:hypothetical protein QC762_610145 [Podospora pseudocomata]|uniref:Uncharacterized protein n=1 Tax=Podospora pseudocomata TaxID=2093779 RepID=A0ABR0G996_9PEZI|nr:hypothetical protein QC762_610145 [Podospora pseudocomata]